MAGTDVNPDFNNQAKIRWKTPRAGSCLTPAVLQEIAENLEITLPNAGNNQDGPCISTQLNNLLSKDASGCFYVAGVAIYQDQQDWLSASPADLTFTGWPANIDGTTALLNFFCIPDPGDEDADVVVKELTSTRIVLTVRKATVNTTVFFRLYQFPVAPEPET